MTIRAFRSLGGILILLFWLPGSLFGAAPKQPEEIWQELSKLPAEERQKRLIAGARAEGKAVIYGNISADHQEWLRVDFNKRYVVKLDGYRASGERVANRLLTEARSNKLDADVLAPSNEHIPALIKAGIAGRYDSPERAAYPDSHKDRDRKSTRLNSSHLGISYAVFCLKKKKKNTTTNRISTKINKNREEKKKRVKVIVNNARRCR